jgi:hydroxypyruvate isomerase
MPQFAANLTMMYPEMGMLERMRAAQQDGFGAVECLFPYAHEAHAWAQQLNSCGLVQALFNAPPGGLKPQDAQRAWDQGERGSACLPGHEREFEAGVRMALEFASVVGCRQIHVMAGCVPPELWHLDATPKFESGVEERATQRTHHHYASVDSVLMQTYLKNLSLAADWARQEGVDILIEPINARDMPHYFLNLQEQAHAVVQALGRPNIKVQMDLYHAQVAQGDLIRLLERHVPTQRVAHLQIAGVPHRHEPDAGEINYAEIFALLDQLHVNGDWDGYVGCEYRPREGLTPGGTHRGLAWMAPYRDSQKRSLGA